MLKRVSAADLIGLRIKEIDEIQKRKGYFSRFLQKRKWFEPDTVHLELKIPHYDLVRGELFCEDINDELAASEDGVQELTFEIDDLLFLLYKDFLIQIRHYDMCTLYDKVRNLQSKYQTRSMDLKKKNEFVWERIEKTSSRRQKIVNYWFEIKKKYVLRGEVFLFDLSNKYQDVSMTVEELISFLYSDFIYNVRQGNNDKIIREILKNLG